MIRNTIAPRDGWQQKIEEQGFVYHSIDGVPYWRETAFYEFTPQQIDDLESATNRLHELCLAAVQHVIDNDLFEQMKIPKLLVPLIIKSWDEEHPAIYGRFDLSYDGSSPPKLLEYNADTPTSLLESAVVQWAWMEERFPRADQFNSIHDRLIAKWRELHQYLKEGPLYFTSSSLVEDFMNVSYMADVARQAGIETSMIPIDEIGWHKNKKRFVDADERVMSNVFKLYPWEWLAAEEFAGNLAGSFDDTFWIEPPWKLILSNKAILPILWDLNLGHPNLLPASFEEQRVFARDDVGRSIRKPFYSREGSNVSLLEGDKNVFSTGGEYGEEGFVYQKYCPLPDFHGNFPVIGSWVVDGVSAGIGIRESDTLITGNTSCFVPHIISPSESPQP